MPSGTNTKSPAVPVARTASSAVVLYDAGSKSREVLTFGFEREDFEVFGTDTASDAAELVRVAGAPILVVSIGTEPDARAEALSFIGSLHDRDAHKGVAIVVLGRRDLREEVLRAGADEFVSWPAFIRDAVTLARLALAARSEHGAGLVGLIEDYEVYFLVRALAAASRSAVIELDRRGRKAYLHVAQGAVVAARVGRLSGVAAFHQLLLWTEASLKLRFVSPPGERKIDAPVEDLLQTGVKFVAEFEALAKRVGGPHVTFEKRQERFDDPSIKVPPEVRSFAESVNGQTLVDLVEQSPFKPFDTIKVCYRLCELGLIAKRDPVRSISPLTAQLAVRDWLLGTAAAAPKATVTEAGRRAAEAYAEAAAARAKAEPMPSDAFAPPQIAGAPSMTMDDAPTSPREVSKGPRARNKAKGEKATKEKPAHKEPVAAKQPVHKESLHKQPVHKEPGHKHASVLARPAPEAPKHAPPKHEPPPEMHMPQATFDDVDEAFFASEAELARVDPVDTFDDLDQTGRKRRVDKKSWSLFGDKPAPKPTGKKKR